MQGWVLVFSFALDFSLVSGFSLPQFLLAQKSLCGECWLFVRSAVGAAEVSPAREGWEGKQNESQAP
jgi:hypothetical protein